MEPEPQIARINFSFTDETWEADTRELHGVMSGEGGWGKYLLDYSDDYTLLLLHLLRIGGIGVFKRVFPIKDSYEPDVITRANELRGVMGKRDISGSLYEIADLFHSDFMPGRTLHNAPFFPGLQAYIRCGGLTPDWLFEMLEHEDCERVILFPGYALTNTESVHFFIQRVMPREALISEIRSVREARVKAMHEAQRRFSENNPNIFPDL